MSAVLACLTIIAGAVSAIWTPIGLQGQNVSSLVFDYYNHDLYAGTTWNGVWRCQLLTGDWEELNHGLANRTVRDLEGVMPYGIISSCPIVFVHAATDSGVYRWRTTIESSPGDTVWRDLNQGLTRYCVTCLASDGIWDIRAGTQPAGAFYTRCSIYSTSWTDQSAGLTGDRVTGILWDPGLCIVHSAGEDVLFRFRGTSGWFIVPLDGRKTSLGIDRSSGRALMGGERGLVLISADGTDWDTLNDPAPTNTEVSAFASGHGALYVGTRGDGVFHTVLNGAVPPEMWSPLGPSGAVVNDIEVLGEDLYIATTDGVYHYAAAVGVREGPGVLPTVPRITCAPLQSGRALTVRCILTPGAAGTVSIYDVGGRCVEALTVSAPGPGIPRSFLLTPRTPLRPGAYFLQLTSGGRSATAKVVRF